MEVYPVLGDSPIFISRGTMVFKVGEKEYIKIHIVGSIKGETKLERGVDDKYSLR